MNPSRNGTPPLLKPPKLSSSTVIMSVLQRRRLLWSLYEKRLLRSKPGHSRGKVLRYTPRLRM